MTKSVRIENADTSSYKVKVTYQSKNAEGEWVNEPGVPTELPFPTAMTTVGLHDSRRVIVEEYGT